MTFSKLQNKLFENYQNCDVTNDQLVQIIEQSALYLNLRTITNYAKENKISYNGALKRKLNKVIIDNQTFIIDND